MRISDWSSDVCSSDLMPHAMSDMWTMPSTSPGRPTNRPNSVAFLTSPSTTEPTGWASAKAPQGFDWACLRPSEMRRLSLSTSRTMTSTSWPVETILPGWTFFLTHDISRSEEHTSELQSLLRTSYAALCLKKKKI